MAAVWPNAIVEDNAIQVHVAALRKVLGATPSCSAPRMASATGWRVTDSAPASPTRRDHAVREPSAGGRSRLRRRRRSCAGRSCWSISPSSPAAPTPCSGTRARPHGRDTPPTIAVLAFQPSDNSEDARLLADGLARSVASSLSRYDVTVIAASSSLQLTPAQKTPGALAARRGLHRRRADLTDHGKLTVSTQVSDTRKNILIFSIRRAGQLLPEHSPRRPDCDAPGVVDRSGKFPGRPHPEVHRLGLRVDRPRKRRDRQRRSRLAGCIGDEPRARRAVSDRRGASGERRLCPRRLGKDSCPRASGRSSCGPRERTSIARTGSRRAPASPTSPGRVS